MTIDDLLTETVDSARIREQTAIDELMAAVEGNVVLYGVAK